MADPTSDLAAGAFYPLAALLITVGGIVLAFGRKQGKIEEKQESATAQVVALTKEVELGRERYHDLANPVTAHGLMIEVFKGSIAEPKGSMTEMNVKIDNGFQRIADAMDRRNA